MSNEKTRRPMPETIKTTTRPASDPERYKAFAAKASKAVDNLAREILCDACRYEDKDPGTYEGTDALLLASMLVAKAGAYTETVLNCTHNQISAAKNPGAMTLITMGLRRACDSLHDAHDNISQSAAALLSREETEALDQWSNKEAKKDEAKAQPEGEKNAD